MNENYGLPGMSDLVKSHAYLETVELEIMKNLMHLNAPVTSSSAKEETLTMASIENLMEREALHHRTMPLAKIILSDHCMDLVQYRFPRSKKRRIRNKWAKRIENFRQAPSKDFKMMGDTLVGHSSMQPVIEALFEAIPKANPLLGAILGSSLFGLPVLTHHSVPPSMGKLDPEDLTEPSLRTLDLPPPKIKPLDIV